MDKRSEPSQPPDLGSYIGSHSLVVGASQPDREVIAVDPDPRNLALIRWKEAALNLPSSLYSCAGRASVSIGLEQI